MILAFILLEYLFCASSIVVKEEKEKEIHMFFLVFRGPKSDNENMFCMDECLCDKCFVHVISVKCMICSSSGFIWKKKNSLWEHLLKISLLTKNLLRPQSKEKFIFEEKAQFLWRESLLKKKSYQVTLGLLRIFKRKFKRKKILGSLRNSNFSSF